MRFGCYLGTPRDSNCSLSTFLPAFWQTWRNLEFVWDGDVAEEVSPISMIQNDPGEPIKKIKPINT